MYSRHDLVWLTDAGWDSALEQVPAHDGALRRWREAGWPLIARRRDAAHGADEVCLGLPLPPQAGTGIKPRIGLVVNAQCVRSHSAALPLARVIQAAPAHWRTGLASLAAIGLRAYGSLAMQALTGLPYLTAASDIDVLFLPRDQSMLECGIALLSSQAARLPLDGEVSFPDGGAVAWKEWRDSAPAGRKVLTKYIDGVHLRAPQALLATLERA